MAEPSADPVPDKSKRGAWPVRILGGLGLLSGLIVLGFVFFGSPKYWRDHTGKQIDEIVQLLGDPHYDDRIFADGPVGEYVLVWYHGWGHWVKIEFEADGRAITQERGQR